MPDPIEIEALGVWDGVDMTTSRIADVLLRFPDYDLPEAITETSMTELLLLIELEKEIQSRADVRFGPNKVRVEATARRGSVEIIVTLSAVGLPVYLFLKDYGDLRAGVLAFIADLRSAAGYLTAIVKKHLKRKKHAQTSEDQQKPKEQHGSA